MRSALASSCPFFRTPPSDTHLPLAVGSCLQHPVGQGPGLALQVGRPPRGPSPRIQLQLWCPPAPLCAPGCSRLCPQPSTSSALLPRWDPLAWRHSQQQSSETRAGFLLEKAG